MKLKVVDCSSYLDLSSDCDPNFRPARWRLGQWSNYRPVFVFPHSTTRTAITLFAHIIVSGTKHTQGCFIPAHGARSEAFPLQKTITALSGESQAANQSAAADMTSRHPTAPSSGCRRSDQEAAAEMQTLPVEEKSPEVLLRSFFTLQVKISHLGVKKIKKVRKKN